MDITRVMKKNWPQPDAKDIKRFMSYVDILPNGCWYWMGGRSKGKGNKKTYGTFNYKGKTVRAHAFSCEFIKKETCPPGHHRDHNCCFSMCVCPDHIDVVTHERNQALKIERQARSVSPRHEELLRSAAVVSAGACAPGGTPEEGERNG